jgi:hypothetical protein
LVVLKNWTGFAVKTVLEKNSGAGSKKCCCAWIVTEKVVRRAVMPVLVVRHTEAED